ncbi:MAG: DUF5630 domain-containing protein, partial [Gammaproteobacteria bacterium]
KSPNLQKDWDQCLIINSSDPRQRLKPSPKLHSLDILISRFLYNKYIEFNHICYATPEARPSISDLNKPLSFLAHAASFGGLVPLQLTAHYLCEFMKTTADNGVKLPLINFLRSLLDEARNQYLTAGYRLCGHYEIVLANIINNNPVQGASTADDFYTTGIKNLRIAYKLENHLYANKAQVPIENAKSSELPSSKDRLFVSDTDISCNSPLFQLDQLIRHNARCDGLYKSKDNFLTVNLYDYITRRLKDKFAQDKKAKNDFLTAMAPDIEHILTAYITTEQPTLNSNKI